MVNEQNYRGANSTVVGYAAGPASKPLWDKDGSSGVLEVAIPVNEGYKKDGEFVQTGTTWYRYSGAGEFAENVLANVQKGDKIRVQDARQEVREYKDKNGDTKLAITLRFGDFIVLEQAGGAASSDSDTPF